MSVETVLVAVDEGDRSRLEALARTAIDISEPAGASVVLVHAFSEEEYEQAKASLEFEADSPVTPTTVARRYTVIRELERSLEDAGVTYDSCGCLSDDESQTVVELARDRRADLVLVGGSNRSPTGKALFGSTAQEIILNAPCPVTLVKNESW